MPRRIPQSKRTSRRASAQTTPELRRARRELAQARAAGSKLKTANAELKRRLAERTAEVARTVGALRASRTRLDSILGAAMDAIVSVDERHRIVIFNPAAERMFGHPASKVLGRSLNLLIPRQHHAAHTRHLEAFVSKGTTRRAADALSPLSALRADGSEFPIEASISYSLAEGRPVFTSILRDVSGRMRAMEAMLENEKALMDFFVAAPIGLLWVKPDGQIDRVNQAELDLLGRTSDEVNGRTLAEFHAEPDVIEAILQRIARHESLRDQRAKVRRKDGSLRHVLIDVNGLWKDRQLVHSRWFVRDITRRLELEREVLGIAERERERIGRELHDDLCQELLGIEFLNETVIRQLDGAAPQVAKKARDVSLALREAMNHARDLAHGLSPAAAMVGPTLATALEDLASRTQALFHRTCTFRGTVPEPLADPAIGIHLIRIAQEAVSNAIRHGNPTRIEIQISTLARDLILGVRDNGSGIAGLPRKKHGMGLRVMQYRAGVINGSLVVQRETNGGTAVICTVKDALRSKAAPPPP
ncbi:PAS domain-containing sensor histidine kinase [Horticoccus sp. 23ND18S-11]|uniref:PAS domain-containing sensor histidine kinase n=1 Tax=Horticoccus sp. 23ND18S-11 TaxID=3391832 RepID=UPI0039C90756